MANKDKDISELVYKYLEARGEDKSIYLDADQFDELADYFDASGDMQEAREVIKAGLKIHPQSSSLLLKKAKFAVYDGDYTKALKLLSDSTSYEFEVYLVKIECFLNLGLPAEAFALTKEVLEEEDTDLDNVYSELGFIYLEADQFNDAILYFEKSLEHNNDNIEVLTDLAYAYEMVGNYDLAIATGNRTLDIDSYNYEAWINLGKLYSLQDEYELAIDAFDFALTIESDDTNIMKLKGHCLSLSGRIQEAIDIFNTVLEMNPDDTSIYFLLAECYQAAELYDKALELLDKYRAETADSGIEFIAKRVQLLLLKDEVELARSVVDKELLEDPDSLPLHIVAAEIRLQQELYDEALEMLLKVYEGNEDDFHLLNMLSTLSIRKEDYDKAIEYTEQLSDIDPEHLEVKQRLALLYFEIDDEENFNALLEEFTDKELLELFKFIYIPKYEDLFDREQLVFYLNDARERRTLFKNLQH